MIWEVIKKTGRSFLFQNGKNLPKIVSQERRQTGFLLTFIWLLMTESRTKGTPSIKSCTFWLSIYPCWNSWHKCEKRLERSIKEEFPPHKSWGWTPSVLAPFTLQTWFMNWKKEHFLPPSFIHSRYIVSIFYRYLDKIR